MQCNGDHAVFCIGTWRSNDWAICAFWVDDETGIGSSHQLQCIVDMFCQKYGISGEGDMQWTLGIGVSHNYKTHTISLSQEQYIDNLLEWFGLQNTTTVTTPLPPGTILTKEQCLTTSKELQDMVGNNYQELIGSIQYIALTSQPDISFTVSKLVQFLNNPSCIHLEATHCVL